jgi:2,3-bisphosphoglycerate-independent phosphoglycerate mutase
MTPRIDRPVVLIVLDGWGFRESREGNAIRLANTPTWDKLWAGAPRTLLDASGRAVGLPSGQMGNSEVGHLNLGAGRVVMQDLVRITAAVEDGAFFQNDAFVAACAHVKQGGGTLHLMGLVGEGGVHAHQDHAVALVDLAERHGVGRVALHCLLDGRDTPPRSALEFTRALQLRTSGRARIASIGGRYYGMDRDQRWHRIEPWYRAAVQGAGPSTADPLAFIQGNYDRDVTDEFMEPAVVLGGDGAAVAPMRDGDALVTWNFRADRMRQIIRAIAIDDFAGFDTGPRPRLYVATMTQYDQTFGLPIAFEPFSMARIMAEVLQEHGLTTLRTAETEKYAHVTYFFNGGNEVPYRGEERILVPSQKVATYDLMPEMSAAGITDVLCSAIEEKRHPYTLCNYANGDMVGHSGNLAATIRACEVVDQQLARIVQSVEKAGARLLITADHGNCEMMIDPETGGPHTAHTTNPVPLVYVDAQDTVALRSGGALCDVGPTVLGLLGVPQPPDMTGRDLRTKGV